MKLEFAFESCLKAGDTVSWHSHKALEIVYYADGEGSVKFGNGPEWDFKPGDFHIAPDGCLHTQRNSSELRALCLGVSGSGLEKLAGFWRDRDGILRYPCESILDELKGKAPSFELVANGILSQIVGLIQRIASEPEKPSIAEKGRGKLIQKALHIIRESGGNTNLDELSDMLFISKDYLRHLLTSATGRSPIKHLIDVRMEHAARMLSKGGLRVEDVARACGFSDAYYFSRLFKKRFSASPAAYRDAEAGKAKKSSR